MRLRAQVTVSQVVPRRGVEAGSGLGSERGQPSPPRKGGSGRTPGGG